MYSDCFDPYLVQGVGPLRRTAGNTTHAQLIKKRLIVTTSQWECLAGLPGFHNNMLLKTSSVAFQRGSLGKIRIPAYLRIMLFGYSLTRGHEKQTVAIAKFRGKIADLATQAVAYYQHTTLTIFPISFYSKNSKSSIANSAMVWPASSLNKGKSVFQFKFD